MRRDCRREEQNRPTDQSSSTFLHSHHAKGADSASAVLVWHSLTFYSSLERRRVMQRTRSWREKSLSSFCSTTGLCAATATWAIGFPKSQTSLAGSKASGPFVHVCVCVYVLKKMLRNVFSLLAAPKHLTLWISCVSLLHPHLDSVSTQHQYMSPLLAKPAWRPFVSQWWRVLPHFIFVWVSSVLATFVMSTKTWQKPPAAQGWGVKRQEASKWEHKKTKKHQLSDCYDLPL